MTIEESKLSALPTLVTQESERGCMQRSETRDPRIESERART
jgi:hypothetical protein